MCLGGCGLTNEPFLRPQRWNEEATLIQTIRSEEWASNLAQLADRHRGWLASILVMPIEDVEMQAPRPRVHEVAVDRPLQDVIFATPEPESEIRIIAGEGSDVLEHAIAGPRSVKLEYNPEGNVMGLRIDDARGQSTLVRFRVAAAPETLDGLAPEEL